MKRVPLLMAGALVAAALNAPAALAQQSDSAPKPAPPPARQAVPRERSEPRHESAPPREPYRPQAAEPRPTPPAAGRQAVPERPPAQNGARRPDADSSSDSDGVITRTVTRGARERGDRPVIGQAVPRTSAPVIGRPRYPYYGGYSPWGYGAFGLGYFYYDPYSYGYSPYGYSPYGYSPYGYDPYGYSPYGGGYGSYSSYDYDSGSLRLKVKPRDAQVFIDGYFTGVVDDFDGILQKLRLDGGPHRVEVRAAGYQPLAFEVRIIPGETVTYKGELRRLP